MPRLTLRFVTILSCLVGTWSCSKTNSEYDDSRKPSRFREDDPRQLTSATPNDELLRIAITSASSAIDTSARPEDDPAAALECPTTAQWSKFDTFAAPCAYAWTTETAQLPSPPLWQPCSDFDDIPRGVCKQLSRTRKLDTFHLGANASKQMQIGFVEPCGSDQIVLADIDGPSRFALRRTDNTQFPTTCQLKLLAVDMGQWLVAAGGNGIPTDSKTSGYSVGGAFVGGSIGSAPTVLFAQSSDPFHVASSEGTILSDGWTANGKRRHWNGKPIEKAPRIGMQRLTKRLLVDEHKGFYSTTATEPELLLEVPKGHTITAIHVADKHVVWLDQSMERGLRTCALVAGEIDAQDTLTNPRRFAEIPCSTPHYVTGCNTVFMSAETHLSLLSLSNGSSRTLRTKGRVAAIDCKEAFVERSGTILRIDLQAFGPPKAPSTPPMELPMKTSAARVPK